MDADLLRSRSRRRIRSLNSATCAATTSSGARPPRRPAGSGWSSRHQPVTDDVARGRAHNQLQPAGPQTVSRSVRPRTDQVAVPGLRPDHDGRNDRHPNTHQRELTMPRRNWPRRPKRPPPGGPPNSWRNIWSAAVLGHRQYWTVSRRVLKADPGERDQRDSETSRSVMARSRRCLGNGGQGALHRPVAVDLRSARRPCIRGCSLPGLPGDHRVPDIR
jgi:hypothetical protein